MSVRFPGNAFNGEDSDLGPPIAELLRTVRVLECDGQETTLKGTPPSLQLLTSGATALAKVWAIVLGICGSAAGVWAAIEAASTDQPVLVASAAFLGAAGLVSAALVVRGDVSARARAASAEYAARASIIAAFLSNTYVGRPPAPTPEKTRYWLRESDGSGRVAPEWKPVDRVEQDASGLIAVLAG